MTGIINGSLSFDERGIFTDLSGQDIRYHSGYAETATFYRDTTDLKISATNIQWKNVALESANFDWKGSELICSVTGQVKDPIHLDISGHLERNGSEWSGTVNSVSGNAFKQTISLENPFSFTKTQEQFICASFTLDFGKGTVFFDCKQTHTKTDLSFNLTQVPLDLLSINPLEVPVSGDFYFDASIHEEYGQTKANVVSRIDNGEIMVQGNPNPIAIQGNLEAALDSGRLKGKTDIVINHQPYLNLDCDIPMTVDTHPFAVHYFLDRKIEGQLSLHGKMEEITDFFNLGTHRVEGQIDCEMKLNGQASHPHIKGSCEITKGHYQNYLTGTELTDVSATIDGAGDRLILKSLTGFDLNCGACTATGEVHLTAVNDFPFEFYAEFAQLGILQLDLVTANAIGKISIKGDLKSAVTKGHVEIQDCEVAIPDKIPRKFPELQVVYKNAPYHIPHKKPATTLPYPLNIDLEVDSPNSIFINGRGLHSEWKGHFSLGGTYTAPSVKGNLELVQGEFVFAGKQFKLIDGSITMQGKAYETPLIDIAANTTEKGISITARIKGPINTPQITFQSSPPMPLSTILSYLIFGKDLSDVSGLQALQLASTIASVAGEGPDILEMTRRSLGVDRLQIVMTPSSLEEGADTISLEIGKVIFPGFLVAVRQGAEDSSPNMAIEVDLTHGFTLGLESQQQLEQGKFSLNWNINY
jgi:translocation and assembly module TamB